MRLSYAFVSPFGFFIGLCSAQGRLPWLTSAHEDETVLLDLLLHTRSNSTSAAMMVDLWSEILRTGDRFSMAATTREVDDLGKELVFGELSAKGVKQLFDAMDMMNINSSSNDVFLDLGSGTAIAVLLVASTLPSVKVIGIEYAVARHEVAKERLRLLATFAGNGNNSDEIEDRVRLFNGNFLDPSLLPHYKDVTVVFSNSIMFSEETQKGIRDLVTDRMPNVRFVVSGIKFHEDCYKHHLDVSWGSESFSLWACKMKQDDCSP